MKQLKLFFVAAMTLAVLVLVGCNTMAGAGEDLQAGGKALTKSADEHS